MSLCVLQIIKTATVPASACKRANTLQVRAVGHRMCLVAITGMHGSVVLHGMRWHGCTLVASCMGLGVGGEAIMCGKPACGSSSSLECLTWPERRPAPTQARQHSCS